MDKQADYIKASDYDLASQRHNHRVFLNQLRRNPWQAFSLSFIFCVLGAAVLYADSTSLNSLSFKPAVLVLICFVAASYFLYFGASARKE